MKKLKFLPIFLSVCLLVCCLPAVSAAALDDPEVESRVAIVMDKNSGDVFYSKNSDQLVYPASTTKIMTVLLAVEAIESGEVSIYDEVTASGEIGYDLLADGSTAGIVPPMYSAMILHASLAEESMAQYSRFSSVIFSPTTMPAVLPSSIRSYSILPLAVTSSYMETSPASMASTASKTVMIFVVLAG